ncbi:MULTISPECIES: hypothetical protein [unclassified Campylobacter]
MDRNCINSNKKQEFKGVKMQHLNDNGFYEDSQDEVELKFGISK